MGAGDKAVFPEFFCELSFSALQISLMGLRGIDVKVQLIPFLNEANCRKVLGNLCQVHWVLFKSNVRFNRTTH